MTKVQRRLGRTRLRVLDAFSGSGSVSRLFKRHARYLAVNDLEDYAAVGGAMLPAQSLDGRRPPADPPHGRAQRGRGALTSVRTVSSRSSTRLRDEAHITPSDRVFYTRSNARRLDVVPAVDRRGAAGPSRFVSGSAAERGVGAREHRGRFQGLLQGSAHEDRPLRRQPRDALERIRGRIALDVPPLSRFECEVDVLQDDANAAVARVRDLDLAYFDPPYNQHPVRIELLHAEPAGALPAP